jgi:hypothetical protein
MREELLEHRGRTEEASYAPDEREPELPKG